MMMHVAIHEKRVYTSGLLEGFQAVIYTLIKDGVGAELDTKKLIFHSDA